MGAINNKIEVRKKLINSPRPLVNVTGLSSVNSTPNIFLNSLKLLLIAVTFVALDMITSVLLVVSLRKFFRARTGSVERRRTVRKSR